MQNKDFSHRYHLLTVSHAAAPWRWPKLFGESWLQFVNEKHCHYTTELRFSDGNLVTQMDLSRHLYLHPTRDLAVLHLEEEKTAHNEIDRVVGLLEGIVPAEYPVEDLQNKAVYMEAKDIQK